MGDAISSLAACLKQEGTLKYGDWSNQSTVFAQVVFNIYWPRLTAKLRCFLLDILVTVVISEDWEVGN